MTPKAATSIALAKSTALSPQVVLNVDAKLRVSRKGTLWTGEVLIETPMGPLRFAASADERLILAWLAQRAKAQGAAVETSGLFDSLKKAARGLAKKLSIKKALESAKRLVKDPVSAAALKLPTLPGPLGAIQRKGVAAAGNLLKRALGGDKRATALLGALKQAAGAGQPGPARAWGMLQRLYRSVRKGSPTSLLRGLGQEAFQQIAPQVNVLRAVEDQTRRLPGPLGTAARAALSAVPGVPLLRGAQAAQQAYEAMLQGRIPVPQAMQLIQQYAPGGLGKVAQPLARAADAFSGYSATWSPEAYAGALNTAWPQAYAPYPYYEYQRGYPYA